MFCFGVQIEELHDEASAVLDGSDEKNCNGLKRRQALYSCLTCAGESVNSDFTKAIGICLACSLKCHENHEMVELYTKRNFECECGIKEGSVKCQLDLLKMRNKETANTFNQNFAGLYCTCHRPYPDPENTKAEEMIQCCTCEDWFHVNHLNAQVPKTELYSEMICGACVAKCEFLVDYWHLTITNVTSDDADTSTTTLDVTTTETSEQDEGAPSPKKVKLSDDACKRPESAVSTYVKGSALFWRGPWRSELCKCDKCIKMYQDLNVEFITDLEDTAHHYEERGKSNPKMSNYDASLEALSSLPRVNQINAITGYNRMKDKLFEFLQTFVNNNQIVTEDDIQRFFRNMKESNEGQQAPSQPHFCR